MDEFIIRNGTIWAREGDILGRELLSGSLDGASINESGKIAFVWGIDVGPGTPDEALFFEDEIFLREGDAVDWDQRVNHSHYRSDDHASAERVSFRTGRRDLELLTLAPGSGHGALDLKLHQRDLDPLQLNRMDRTTLQEEPRFFCNSSAASISAAPW